MKKNRISDLKYKIKMLKKIRTLIKINLKNSLIKKDYKIRIY